MTWERFGYICRKASVDGRPNEKVKQRINRIEREEACAMYGPEIKPDSWPRKILDDIAAIKIQQPAQEIIGIYRDLNLTHRLELPLGFKRVIGYLFIIAIIFFVVATVYQTYVLPSFIEMFGNFDIPIPPHLALYQQYWIFFEIFVLAFLGISLLIGFRLKALFYFKCGIENSLVMKYLFFPGIRQSYQRLITILRYPLLGITGMDQHVDIDVANHLRAAQKSGIPVSEEMQALIEIEMRSLIERSEQQMKVLAIFIALMVVAAIFLFLVSAYSPIFILGETI
jgi:hypothetical protein